MNWEMIIGIGQIVAVAIIPVIVWFLGVKHQDRKAKRDAQSLFKAIRKKWSLFRKKYEDEFQNVRNKVGAHREHDVMTQINTIEALNWSHTIELLLEYEKLTIEIAPYFSTLVPAVVNGVGRFCNQ